MTEHEEIGLRKMFLRVVRGYLTEETDSIPSELIDEVAAPSSQQPDLQVARSVSGRWGG